MINRSDDQKDLQSLSSTIYYMVVFPSINDSGVITDTSAYGEKLLVSLSEKEDENERIDQLESYLQRKGKENYQIEQVNARSKEETVSK